MPFDSVSRGASIVSLSSILLLMALVPACGGPAPVPTDSGSDGSASDSSIPDAFVAPDAFAFPDANAVDANTVEDASVVEDASALEDASVTEDGGGATCSPPGIGAACDTDGSCQSGLRCYTGSAGDFCSVDRSPDCGGFVMARCPASAPYCLRPVGSSLGACATADEAVCICAIASDRIQPGEGTDGCPMPPRP